MMSIAVVRLVGAVAMLVAACAAATPAIACSPCPLPPLRRSAVIYFLGVLVCLGDLGVSPEQSGCPVLLRLAATRANTKQISCNEICVSL
jgi:hypothetical protein